MKNRAHLLQAMLDDGIYPIDERSVAEAILARVHVRLAVADVGFRRSQRVVRSFRHDGSARSFRLARPAARRRSLHA